MNPTSTPRTNFRPNLESLEGRTMPSAFVGRGSKWHDNFCYERQTPLTGDFNGDGKDDVIIFTRSNEGDVFVALSTGGKFDPIVRKWHDNFCFGTETPMIGDFNGDGKDDIATFTKGDTGDVYVALSDGKQFNGRGWKWHDNFSFHYEQPLVGDFNGDGKDDIASYHGGDQGPDAGDIYVALSDGSRFNGRGVKWRDGYSIGTSYAQGVPMVGDFNGDGKDDIAEFTRYNTGDVLVTLSTGTRFSPTTLKWHDNFCFGEEVPRIGDFNGDGKDDIATFTRGYTGDVYVALSDGKQFNGRGWKWHDNFCFGHEIPHTGDFNGDGKDDIVAFTHFNTADVYVALAQVG